jgi:Na+(H+)/acetate symporter ActP
MNVDPYIFAFSAITVVGTIWMGFVAARKSRTAHDFFVAGRSVSVGWNASAISGEYLSAASFMGVAGMVMSSGYDALWYPVCYACGYLFLLLFIAGPLRRFGAYTIPDFAEGRYDSPLFRKIAVVFVLFIGFFYTMPQMKGAGTTLAYIFPGLPYWAGVVLVGAVITLNVALGGMKGITLVQAVQYWAKMFAISVPIFVLMAVYGHYGKQLDLNSTSSAAPASGNKVIAGSKAQRGTQNSTTTSNATTEPDATVGERLRNARIYAHDYTAKHHKRRIMMRSVRNMEYNRALRAMVGMEPRDCRNLLIGDSDSVLNTLAFFTGWKLVSADTWPRFPIKIDPDPKYPLPNVMVPRGDAVVAILEGIENTGGRLLSLDDDRILLTKRDQFEQYVRVAHELGWINSTRKPLPEKAPQDATWIAPFGPLTTKAAKAAKLSIEQSKPYSLLYTYSLIIALVCGTAGLPHILVRFYTNPDGVAAKRTTMWVMILIGVFYLFPPVFGVLGRNLLPELYAGVGAKGTDKIVLELPRLLNDKYAPLGSILSGITCAGAFAAFMSTFSGLLVSMTGALAHDVYGRMLRPRSSPDQRMRAFKVCAVVVGGIAILLGMQVEPFQINFMVGQAFAIAAASYFPLLFMSAWWRGMTMKGAAAGMLAGGLLALAGISLTSFTDLNWLPLQSFWAAHPLLRILCEQPAIWTVPLAILLMVVISKLTSDEVPADIRMKMLVLHAPEKLGLKQEYVQEHGQPDNPQAASTSR